ncbi:MAG: hypothetical protein ABI440_01635 [Casimicrobiaceae bacterium]
MRAQWWAAVAVSLLASACAFTSNTRISESEGSAQHAYQRIAVIALSASKSERETFDTALVARLGRAGIEGIAGDRYIEDAAAANGVAPMEAIRAARADAVIYVWLGSDNDTPGVGIAAGSRGSTTAWYTPTLASSPTARFEARLYDVGTQKLAWAGTSTTLYPKSLAVDAPAIADAFVGALVKRGFIAGSH